MLKKTVLVSLLGLLAWSAGARCAAKAEPADANSPLDELPSHIRRITHFGQRADWSHDGKRILFVEKTFGDVYEVELETNILRPMTHRYFHEGYTRALYLSNGDLLLSGARQFDAANPWASRNERNAELWVLKKDLLAPPTPLGEKCSEGPAVSRRRMHIVWTQGGAFYSGDIVYEEGVPKIVKKKKVLEKKDLEFDCSLETQNLRPPKERELIFSAYGYQGTEVCGLDIRSGKVINYSMSPDQYDEPEGIFPDGKHTLVECDKHSRKGVGHIDLYKLALDGSGRTRRMTFFSDYPGYKASNPAVSDDGRYIAFQVAKEGDPAGVGRGILIFDVEKFEGHADSNGNGNGGGSSEGGKEEENTTSPEIEQKPLEPTTCVKIDEDAVEQPPAIGGLEARIERIKSDYGVTVHHEYDPQAFFPPRWLAGPINGQGAQMPRSEVERAVAAIERFVRVYPEDLLGENLTDIYLISGLRFYGKGFGAAYGSSALYVNNEGVAKGYTDEFLVSQMHSELSSIFLMNYRAKFPEEEWKAANAEGWEYRGTGVEMLGRRDIFSQTNELLSHGFLVRYSQSSLENDLNMFAFWAFTKAERLRELASRYIRINRKFRLMVQFYEQVDPRIAVSSERQEPNLATLTPEEVSTQNGG